MALDWYFRVQVGREDRIRKSIVKRLKQKGLDEQVPQVIVPTETVAEHLANLGIGSPLAGPSPGP